MAGVGNRQSEILATSYRAISLISLCHNPSISSLLEKILNSEPKPTTVEKKNETTNGHGYHGWEGTSDIPPYPCNPCSSVVTFSFLERMSCKAHSIGCSRKAALCSLCLCGES